MGKYVRIAETKKISKNKIHLFKVNDNEILVVNITGKFYAFENRCPHMGYPLYLGSLEGKVLTCGFHFEKFDVETGKSLGLITHKSIRTFKTKIQNSTLLIKL
jgi:nitrite reductase/ring-hydroxylating ferredoxin subunit